MGLVVLALVVDGDVELVALLQTLQLHLREGGREGGVRRLAGECFGRFRTVIDSIQGVVCQLGAIQ